MKIFQKTLSLMLVLAMLCSFLPVMAISAGAAEEETLETTVPMETISQTEPAEETLLAETVPVELNISEVASALEVLSSSDKGTCGNNLVWRLDKDGTLTIQGTGEMTSAPWLDEYVSEIKKVIIEDGATNVCKRAFLNCFNLTSVMLSESINSIDNEAFRMCSKLTSIVLPESVTSIGESAFDDCCNLASINIPAAVTSIGPYAFYGCAFSSIILPEKITSIPASAFSWCEELTSIIIPQNVTSIERNAFNQCINLSSITLPEKLSSIGEYAFRCCKSLSSISIPKAVTSIENSAFARCDSLISFSVEDTNESFRADDSGVLYTYDYTTLVAYPCGKDGSYTVNSQTNKIGDGAFNGCKNLKSLILPKNLIHIGKEAFYLCEVLTSITFKGNAPSIDSSAFYNISATCYYPADNTTWTDDVKQDYGGSLTWVPVTEEHIFGEVTYIWSEDFTTCTAVRVCTNPGCTDEETETASSTVATQAATCTKDGKATYTAIFTSEAFENQTKEIILEKLGHSTVTDKGIEATCTKDGLTDGSHCERCNEVLVEQETIPALGHTWDNGTVTKEPTEEETGIRTYNCENCDESKTETIEKLEHTHKYESVVTAPTCTEAGYTTYTCKCGDSFVSDKVVALGHKEVIDNGKAATCTEAGLTGGTHCERCNTVLTKQEELPALGHSWDDGTITKEPTEEETGIRTFNCENCEETRTEIIDKLQHTHRYTTAVTAPTCTAQGYTTYTCICGESYVGDYVDATGHSFGDWYQTKAPTEEVVGEERRDCANCDAYETQEVEKIQHTHSYTTAVTAPTCTEQGYTTYTCSCGDTYTDDEVDALGHTEVVDEAEAATCTEAGLTEGTHCSVCNETILAQKEVAALGHSWDEGTVTKEPTEEETGIRTYHCDNCEETKTEEIPVLNHEHSYTAVVTEPTCINQGYTTYTCVCGDTYTADETDALGHTEVVDEAVAATCTESGLTEGSHCSVCNETIIAQEEVSALGHTWDEGTITQEPTAEEPGIMTYECIVCEETMTEEIPYEAPEEAPTAVQRIAGADRIETALAVAKELKVVLGVEKFDSIILAAGGSGSDQTKFADALSGSYLASAKKAPILLYTKGDLSSKNIAFIEENLSENGTIYLLGGNVSIPAEVEDSLNASGYTTKRLGGADRYQTNLIILDEAGIDSADEILIAGGQAFADSLSASATGLPIMLVNGTKTALSSAQVEFLQNLNGKKVTILGGTAAVSADLEAAIEEAVGGTADRIYGDARENTSAMIAEKYFADADMALIAYSRMYPDGLAGGVLANALHAPLLLTKAGSESIANAYIEEYGIEAGYALGGTAVMTDDTVRAVFGLAEDAIIALK